MRRLTSVMTGTLLMMLVVSMTACAAPVTIVQDGRPLAVIVTPQAVAPEIELAAGELQDCVRAASGAELQSVTGPEVAASRRERARCPCGADDRDSGRHGER